MTHRRIARLFAGLFLALVFCRPPPAAAAVYEIDPFTAVFELVQDKNGNLNDVRVQMDVAYVIRRGPKSSGFKNVGLLPVRDISVTDEDGRPLAFKTRKFKYTKITWTFPETREGTRRVHVAFTLAGAVQTSESESRLDLAWIDQWRVPVRDVTYIFLLPEGHNIHTLDAAPLTGELTEHAGRPAYAVHVDRIENNPFSVVFSPPLPQKPPSIFSRIFSVFAFIAEKIVVVIVTILGLAAFVGGFFLLLHLYQRFGPKGGGRGGGGPADGGCAGGCGGGGGGGGCGGGGCGG